MSHRVLSGLQFEHVLTKEGDHELTATHPDRGEVGYMNWYGHKGGPDAAPGEVSMIQTWPGNRREGVATQLWHKAHEYYPPVHSPVFSNGDAEKWARSVGGPGL